MNKEHIQQLIDRYDEGMTSNAEERELREFFRQHPASALPQEWAAYKAIFAFVDSEAATMAVTTGKEVESPLTVNRITPQRRLFTTKRIVAAAACAAIAVTIVLHTVNTGKSNYAVINGNTVTDKSVVMTEAETALQMVAYSDESFGALDAFEDAEE